jgi:type I restriction enzyme M protein
MARNSTLNNTGATIGFEQKLWAAADALRNNMDAAEYKHVVPELTFVTYISDAFEAKHAEIARQQAESADPQNADEYRAQSIFWVPPEARWQFNVPNGGGERLRDDKRWQYGVPPAGSANLAWVQRC